MSRVYSVPSNHMAKAAGISSAFVIISVAFLQMEFHIPAAVMVCILIGYLYSSSDVAFFVGIEIDENAGTVTFINKTALGKQVVEVVPFDSLNFTYRRVTDYTAICMQHISEEDVLIINSEDKTLACLTPGEDGWTNELVASIASEMMNCHVKRIAGVSTE
ncbi:hypothetical protein DYU05_15060 [Mucilaginibacter terrenus]|uniref:Uncharacterized protein n=1 Tax=Mucilaginibacter terrenus TaxID=2482727 RepID=A0A3E2NR27_9SPHI|nr:hypothetical protein [Mucilaginibacter terrenus]RFZ83448.1 hypothetical protein DYU05_15060 [Mucilaginibacter terrenus]